MILSIYFFSQREPLNEPAGSCVVQYGMVWSKFLANTNQLIGPFPRGLDNLPALSVLVLSENPGFGAGDLPTSEIVRIFVCVVVLILVCVRLTLAKTLKASMQESIMAAFTEARAHRSSSR